MLDGFWVMRIETPQYTSGGVVIFINGKVFGGDNGFTWVGSYSQSGQILKGLVRIHNFDESVQSVLGIPGDYDMHFAGTIEANTITGTAMVANQPQHNLPIRLTKRADL